jgi:hypothetical protein
VRFSRPRSTKLTFAYHTCACLNESFVMGSGGRGRGGSTSRHEGNESSREKKESKPAKTDVSADEILKMVAKFLKELSSNTNRRRLRVS